MDMTFHGDFNIDDCNDEFGLPWLQQGAQAFQTDDFLYQAEDAFLPTFFDLDYQGLLPYEGPTPQVVNGHNTRQDRHDTEGGLRSQVSKSDHIGNEPSQDCYRAGLQKQGRRPPAQPIDPKQWADHLDTISSLYLDHTLAQIRDIVWERHAFAPSLKQFKKKLSEWQSQGLLPTKNIRRKDMLLMTQLEDKRLSEFQKSSRFTYHGFPVEPGRLERFRKKERKESDIELREHPIPPYIRCSTPVDDYKQMPDNPTARISTEDIPVEGLEHDTHFSESRNLDRDYSMSEDTPVQTFDSQAPTQLQPQSAAEISDSSTVNRRISGSPMSRRTNEQQPNPLASADWSTSMTTSTEHAGKVYRKGRDDSDASAKLFLQPETRVKTTAQLVNELKRIYAGLVMIEKKTIGILAQLRNRTAQEAADKPVTGEQYQALTALHRTLLYEHHDFFLTSQHPCSSEEMRRLATKYSMPARMWRHSIHEYLEFLRGDLPHTTEHMKSYLGLAYQMLTLLFETAPIHSATWTECLGDLARYRYAVEDEDVRDQNIWRATSKRWYQITQDDLHGVGRLCHHLAVCSQDSPISMIGYLAQNIMMLTPFAGETSSPTELWHVRLSTISMRCAAIEQEFVQLHMLLSNSESRMNTYSALYSYLKRLSVARLSYNPNFQLNSAFVNILSLLDYGSDTSLLNTLLRLQATSRDPRSGKPHNLPNSPIVEKNEIDRSFASDEFSPQIFNKTFSAAIAQALKANDGLIHIHIILVFIRALTRLLNQYPDHHAIITKVLSDLPWVEVADLLNNLKSGQLVTDVNGFTPFSDTSDLPSQTVNTPLPEDHNINGQFWAHHYYSERHFDNRCDVEERQLEHHSYNEQRVQRVFWLGGQIAMQLDSERLPELNLLPLRTTRYLCYDPVLEQFYAEPSESTTGTLGQANDTSNAPWISGQISSGNHSSSSDWEILNPAQVTDRPSTQLPGVVSSQVIETERSRREASISSTAANRSP